MKNLVKVLILLIALFTINLQAQEKQNTVLGYVTESIYHKDGNTANLPYDKAAQYVEQGLAELGLIGVNVRVMPIADKMKEKYQGGSLKGYVEGAGGYYTLYLGEISNVKIAEIVAHELIHVKQLHTGQLIKLGGNKVIYLEKEYHTAKLGYHGRPWETDAYSEGAKLERNIKKHKS